jgi:hypothetical protein
MRRQDAASVAVCTAAASALVALGSLPRSLNPVVRPLMHSLKVPTFLFLHTVRLA